MENTKDSNVLIDKILKLQDEGASYSKKIDVLTRELGAKESHIETLKQQIQELKDKEPQVRVIAGKKVETFFGTITEEGTTEYRNLDSVKLDIEKLTEKKFKVEIDKLEKELKSAKSEVEDSTEKIEKLRKTFDSEAATIRQNYSLKKDEIERDSQKVITKKDLRITELEEELVKVKEDKTDEQLESKRLEEVTKLKLLVKDYKKQLDDFMSLNLFKRVWLALTNKAIRIAAEKEVLEKEREIEKLQQYPNGKGLMDQIRNLNNPYHWFF